MKLSSIALLGFLAFVPTSIFAQADPLAISGSISQATSPGEPSVSQTLSGEPIAVKQQAAEILAAAPKKAAIPKLPRHLKGWWKGVASTNLYRENSNTVSLEILSQDDEGFIKARWNFSGSNKDIFNRCDSLTNFPMEGAYDGKTLYLFGKEGECSQRYYFHTGTGEHMFLFTSPTGSGWQVWLDPA